MSFVGIAVAAVSVAATTYGAVSASDSAAAGRKALDLNSAAGRKTAEQIAQQQHDDTIRQLNDQVNQFKAETVLAAQAQDQKKTFDNRLLLGGAALGGWLIYRKFK